MVFKYLQHYVSVLEDELPEEALVSYLFEEWPHFSYYLTLLTNSFSYYLILLTKLFIIIIIAKMIFFRRENSTMDESAINPFRGTERNTTWHRNESRAILTISIRGPEAPFSKCTFRFKQIQTYAGNVGADFILIQDMDHEALQPEDGLQNLIIGSKYNESDVKLRKFYSLYYYLKRYDAVIWLDDTIRINPHCDCTPNLFEIAKPNQIVAARDSFLFSDFCKRLRELANFFVPVGYCKINGNPWMFNSGLMLFRKKYHMQFFDIFAQTAQPLIHFLEANGMFDQPIFNYYVRGLGFSIYDLNIPNPMVSQGSDLKKNCIVKLKQLELVHCILHATRGSRNYNKIRRIILCQDFDWCSPNMKRYSYCTVKSVKESRFLPESRSNYVKARKQFPNLPEEF